MRRGGDWQCGCRAMNAPAALYCDACGAERPRARLTVMSAPAKLPTYPTPTAADDAAAKEALHTIKALIHDTATRMGTPRERPARPKLIPVAIDPAIRRAVDGR